MPIVLGTPRFRAILHFGGFSTSIEPPIGYLFLPHPTSGVSVRLGKSLVFKVLSPQTFKSKYVVNKL